MWKGKYQSTDDTKYGNGKRKLFQKLKRCLEERHIQTHGNSFKIV